MNSVFIFIIACWIFISFGKVWENLPFRFVIEAILNAGGQPCPPVVVGIGIGGGADIALKLGKKQLLRTLGERHSDPKIAQLEEDLLKAINMTGFGSMG